MEVVGRRRRRHWGRKMKSREQLEGLERFYNEERNPTEAQREAIAANLGLTKREVMLWFGYRRHREKTLPPESSGWQERSTAAAAEALASLGGGDPMAVMLASRHEANGVPVPAHSFEHCLLLAHVLISPPPLPRLMLSMPTSDITTLSLMERRLGRLLREDGPILGMHFDPLPPGAFDTPRVMIGEQQQQKLLSKANVIGQHGEKSSEKKLTLVHQGDEIVLLPGSSSNYTTHRISTRKVPEYPPCLPGSGNKTPIYTFQGQLSYLLTSGSGLVMFGPRRILISDTAESTEARVFT